MDGRGVERLSSNLSSISVVFFSFCFSFNGYQPCGNLRKNMFIVKIKENQVLLMCAIISLYVLIFKIISRNYISIYKKKRNWGWNGHTLHRSPRPGVESRRQSESSLSQNFMKGTWWGGGWPLIGPGLEQIVIINVLICPTSICLFTGLSCCKTRHLLGRDFLSCIHRYLFLSLNFNAISCESRMPMSRYALHN